MDGDELEVFFDGLGEFFKSIFNGIHYIFKTIINSIHYIFTTIHRTFVAMYRSMLYAGRKIDPGCTENTPEGRGFPSGQVATFTIKTKDGEHLDAWLIMPTGVYEREQASKCSGAQSWQQSSKSTSLSRVLELLQSDSTNVLTVFFHGNRNNIATWGRSSAYRRLTSISPEHLYVLAFDYRGFGRSSGISSEQGLLHDVAAVLKWVESTAQMPIERVLLFGQSLGCAVVLAGVQQALQKNPDSTFAGLVLCSPFTDVPHTAPNFKLGGLPLLKPLTWTDGGRHLLESCFSSDTWPNRERIKEVVTHSKILRLTIIHAKDDEIVPASMSALLYADVEEILRKEQSFEWETTTNAAEYRCCTIATAGSVWVKRTLLDYGGHRDYFDTPRINAEVKEILERPSLPWTMTNSVQA